MLVRIPYDRTAEHVAHLLARKMESLPAFLRNSVTWDQGKELAAHEKFTVKTGLPVYFCDPHSPWQRGSNENTNGLLRQYFPKGTDLSGFTQAELDAVATRLNNRPRRTPGSRPPPKNSTNYWSMPMSRSPLETKHARSAQNNATVPPPA